MKKKYKLSGPKKALISIGLVGTLTIVGGVKVFYDFEHPSDYSQNSTSIAEVTNEDKYIDGNYNMDVKVIDEQEYVKKNKSTTKINLDSINEDEFIKNLNDYSDDFDYSKYYHIEEALEVYNSVTNDNKNLSNNLIGTDGKLDANKLYNSVIENNKKYKGGKVNAVNAFYSDTNPSDIMLICNIIKEVVDSSKYDTKEICRILEKLTIFNNTGMASNALVNDEFTLQYNPSMTDMYYKVQLTRGNNITKEEMVKNVIVHEIEHLIEYKSNDLNDKNGLEAGPFRRYDNVSVNPLWCSWILESSAELEMANYLNVSPSTYRKPISYMKSYVISRIFEDDFDIDSFKDISFTNNLEELFEKLGIVSKSDKMDFLKFAYSVELGQFSDRCDDFWENYEKEVGLKLTDDDKLHIRMEARQDSVIYLTKQFYKGLSSAIANGKINDIETVFYFMRAWELDCYNHLEYNEYDNFEYAKDFILFQDEIQRELFNVISNSNNISYEELSNRYDTYSMKIIDDNLGKTGNYNLNNFSNDKKNFIIDLVNNYRSSNYSRNKDMKNYIDSLQKGKSY